MSSSFSNHPKNPNTKIWRYIDLPKYLYLLRTKSLYFPRSDLLGDYFEGSFPQTNILKREKFYRNLFPSTDFEKYKETISKFATGQTNLHKLVVPRVYINCWHASGYESQAMWELYAERGKGIAIRTTYARLKSCLPSSINIGLVKYISYSKNSSSFIPEEDPIAPFFYKRKSYEHEKELRAIYFNEFSNLWKLNNPGNFDLLELPENYASTQKPGTPFPVDLDTLIERIYVHPFIEDWIYETILDVTSKYGISKNKIRHSTLEKNPLF